MRRQGSTKNERKVNVRRAEEARDREVKTRTQLDEPKRLPVNQRPENYAKLLQKLRIILNKARSMQKRSENDTQTGKRGRR